MTSEYTDTEEFRGARFTSLDFSGVVIRDCDVRKLKIVDSHLVGVNISPNSIGSPRVHRHRVIPTSHTRSANAFASC